MKGLAGGKALHSSVNGVKHTTRDISASLNSTLGPPHGGLFPVTCKMLQELKLIGDSRKLPCVSLTLNSVVIPFQIGKMLSKMPFSVGRVFKCEDHGQALGNFDALDAIIQRYLLYIGS